MKKILLLDDHFEILVLLRTAVNQMGYAVRSANNGEEALRVLARESIDLIITDVMMPGMDGWEFLAQARARGYAGKVLVITAFPKMIATPTLKTLRVDHVLFKPIQLSLFEQQLHALLEPPQAVGTVAGAGSLSPDAS